MLQYFIDFSISGILLWFLNSCVNDFSVPLLSFLCNKYIGRKLTYTGEVSMIMEFMEPFSIIFIHGYLL